MVDVTSIEVRLHGPEGAVRRFRGRFAWTLAKLIQAGDEGVTPIEHPAPRWSHYVYRLRREGVPIETIEEKHGGPYRGRHGRYRLTAPIEVIREVAS